MARKIVNSEVFEINTSSMSKPRKILYNKITQLSQIKPNCFLV